MIDFDQAFAVLQGGGIEFIVIGEFQRGSRVASTIGTGKAHLPAQRESSRRAIEQWFGRWTAEGLFESVEM